MARLSIRHASGAKPRVLVVTPEIAGLPRGMGSLSHVLTAKAGGLADVATLLVSTLFERGADVHVAVPHYRRLFNVAVDKFSSDELWMYTRRQPASRIHLAEDRIFYYRDHIYSYAHEENPRIAVAFQREVLNNIIPQVRPDLIHCHDWMTGLVPALAKRLSIPCLFTFHNIHSHRMTLAEMEDRGIDAAEFWGNLYFSRMPRNYEETRACNPVDLLVSGILAADCVNTVSPTFLNEVVDGRHTFVPECVRREVARKRDAGCAFGLLNAPDASFDPTRDPRIVCRFTAETQEEGKRANKRALQEKLGLEGDDRAPLFFWPSRLDPAQKGCQVLAQILHETVSTYWREGLQVAIVANGPSQRQLHDVARRHNLQARVAVRNFDESLSHLAYAAADFVLMPSSFEPCGLPQMIGNLYGALTLAHDTGGLHDTVRHLDPGANVGNGFLFAHGDAAGLRWAIDQAMAFHRQPADVKAAQIRRIMRESAERFLPSVAAERYFELYERMLERPLIPAPRPRPAPATAPAQSRVVGLPHVLADDDLSGFIRPSTWTPPPLRRATDVPQPREAVPATSGRWPA